MSVYKPHENKHPWNVSFLRRKEEFLRTQPGPRDHWRHDEDTTTQRGLTISDTACYEHGADLDFMTVALGGVVYPLRPGLAPRICEDYPNYTGNKEAGAEIDRLTSLNKIHWYEPGSTPPDLLIAPSKVVIKPDKTRVVHDWSAPQGGPLNEYMGPVDVRYGTMDAWLRVLYPGAWMAGLDLMDCFLTWPVHPSQRRLLGIRHPITGVLGCYLFMPFGVGPCPGVNDWCMKHLLDIVQRCIDDVTILDFVDDLRLVKTAGRHRGDLAITQYQVSHLLEKLGARVHTKPKKWIPPTQRIGWIGHDVDTQKMTILVQPEKREKCTTLLEQVLQDDSKNVLRAKTLASCVGILNFVAICAPGGTSHLRSWWDSINSAGAYTMWQTNRRADPLVSLANRGKKDARWWLDALNSDVTTPIFHSDKGCFIWHAKLKDPLEWILSMNRDNVAVIATDASKVACGATWDHRYLSEPWSKKTISQTSNVKELTAFRRCLQLWETDLRRRLILWKSDNRVALRYINGGSGQSAQLNNLADDCHGRLLAMGSRVVGIHLPGIWNSVADALSRGYAIPASGSEGRHLLVRDRFWAIIQRSLPDLTWEMMSHPEAIGNRLAQGGSVDDSALEKPLPPEPSWWFPGEELRKLTVAHILRELRREPSAKVAILLPEFTAAGWYQHVRRTLRKAVSFPPGTSLFCEKDGDDYKDTKTCGKTKITWCVYTNL